MAKVTSKLLTLMLSFAMVFTSMVWLGASEVNAAEGDTQLIVKLVDESDQPVAGISLKGEFKGEAGTPFEFDGPSNDEGLAVFDYEDVDDLMWVEEGFPDDYYEIVIDGDSEYSFDPVKVEFGANDAYEVFCSTVGGEAYSQAEPYVIHMTKESAAPDKVDYVATQKNDNTKWGTFGINYADITSEDFILDVRPDTNWKSGHLAGATHVNVALNDTTQVDADGYVVEGSALANDLDAAYAAAGSKRVVVVCVRGQVLAARTLQYFNNKYFDGVGVDLSKVTFLVGGATAIPEEDLVTLDPAPDTTVPRREGESRSKTMTVKIDMSKYDKGQVVKVWVPVPQTEEFQTISNEKFAAKTAKDARFTTSGGNKMLYIEWDENAEPSDRIAKLSFDATRVEAGHPELVAYDESKFVWPEDVAEYIDKTSMYVKIDGVVKEYADQITEGKTGTLEKARAIYEFIIANLERIDNGETLTNAKGETQQFVVEGCGYGDTQKILTDLKEFGRAGGHCTDLNSTFVALCRAAGIPAREMFGIRLGTNDTDNASGFQHCWAEFYLPGTGWVYADPGDVLKAIKPGKEKSIEEWESARASDTCKEKTDYFWGTVDNNRIVLSRGRDVTFEPAQAWGPCNTFGYPAAEVGGVRTPKDFTVPGDFVYEITTKNVEEPVDFVAMQKDDKTKWGTYGISYADITAEDFILDVRPDNKWNEGHLPDAAHVNVAVTDEALVDANGYVVEGSALAKDLDAAYETAGNKRIVIICNGGQTLAARAMQYFNATGKFMEDFTYLIGGRSAIPDEDVVVDKWGLGDFVIDGTTITGLTDSGKEKLKEDPNLVLPDKNAVGKYITAIGNGTNGIGTFGFTEEDKTYVPTGVTFPAKLETIGNFAFSAVTETVEGVVHQTGLAEVTFPDTLKSIGTSAFANAPLTEVVLPDSVETLGPGAFTALNNVEVRIKKVTLSKNLTGTLNATFNNQAIEGELEIPAGVTAIGANAFAGNRLTKVIIPDGVTSIGNNAFQSNDLEEVDIPGSVKTIGNYAFRFTNTGGGRESKLTKVTLHEGLTSIGNATFGGNKIVSVDLPTTVTTLHKDAFKDCAQTVKVISTVEDQINGTGDYAKVVPEGSGHKIISRAEATADEISDLPKEITDENVSDAALAIAEARAKYEALSPEEKDALPAGTVEKLEAAEAKLDAYATNEKAAAIVDLANEIVAAADVDSKLFTAATVEAFDAAVDAAKAALNNKDATTADLKKAAADLKAAKEALKEKAANTLSVTKKTKTVKAAKVKKAKQTVKAITVKKHAGKVTFKKVSGKAQLSVNSKTGKITVKKGTKKGTYSIKVKVTAAGDGNHKAGSKTVTVKIKVK